MRSDYVLEGETLDMLALRLRVPACAIMRFNGLYSPAWLLPGREIIVPEGECAVGFPCPRQSFARPVRPDRPRRTVTAGPFDTAASLAAKYHEDEAELRRENRLDGCVYPGMELLVSDGE